MSSNSLEESIDNLSEASSDIPKWSDKDDVKLLYSMFDLKPVGIHKHFYMCEIVNNLNELQKNDGLPLVTPDTLWTRLSELYNLKLLEEYEPSPQTTMEEVDFDKVVEQPAKSLEDSDEDKPLVSKLLRSESEESKDSKVSTVELETEENNGVKLTKNARKKSFKMEENISSEEDRATKTLRSRGSGAQKLKSPVVVKKKK